MSWLIQIANNLFNNVSGGFLRYIVLSIQIAFTFGLLWFFRKPLNKAASMKYAIRLVSSNFFFIAIFNAAYHWMLDVREWYSFFGIDLPAPLLHFFIPAKITSQIAEIPSTHSVDWLSVSLIAWIAGIIFFLMRRRAKKKAFRRMIDAPHARVLCPEHMQKKLQALLRQDERWNAQHGEEYTPTHIELYHIKGISSPCTFDTNTKRPVIALDRLDYTDEELDYILRHELSHITLRHEYVTSLLHMMRVFCWFNPLLIPIERWSCKQIELVTDDDVLTQRNAGPAERISYARLLVNLAQEQQLQGVALHLSAGAQFIRQRTEAILRPHRRALTLPVTILLIILALHTTLLLAPGETPKSRFDSRSDLLACLGNDYKYVTRGLDPFINETSYQSFRFDSHPMYIERDDNNICYLEGYIDMDLITNDSEISEYKKAWLDDISSLLGQPSASVDEFVHKYYIKSSEVYRWPVTLSTRAAERMWGYAPELVELELIWEYTHRDAELIEHDETYRLVGHPDDYFLQITLQPAE